MQDKGKVLGKERSGEKRSIIPLRTKTPLHEKQSKWLTERDEEREKEGGGGKTRQPVRGRLDERGSVRAGANAGERGTGGHEESEKIIIIIIIIWPQTISAPGTERYLSLLRENVK